MNRVQYLEAQTKRREQRRPSPLKVIKPIARRSKKRIASDKILGTIRMNKIAEDITCKIQSPDCTGFFQGLHHVQKSTPSNRLKEDNLVGSCNACNLYVELQLEWAKANGFFKSRFAK